MNLKAKDHFYRDDYSVAIADIRLVADEAATEFYHTDTVIYIDDFIYKYHGFRTQTPPTRKHLTNYMQTIVPAIFQHDAH
jgi:hypothetical protein